MCNYILMDTFIFNYIYIYILIPPTSHLSSDMQQNAQAFSWPSRLVPVLEEHKIIIRTSREKAEDALRTRREKFVEELSVLKKQIAELRELGDVKNVATYLKKAQSMQGKLDSALERIDEFNKEEEAFEWEQTTYPLRHKLVQELEPFLKLYEAISAFHTQHAQWMDGPFAEINPEFVEAESGNIWRTLYKLEKSFSEEQAPREMAATVKAELDEFKENIPLIQVGFKPLVQLPSTLENCSCSLSSVNNNNKNIDLTYIHIYIPPLYIPPLTTMSTI